MQEARHKMIFQEDFYRNITDVPELPSDLFDSIDRSIRRRTLAKRSIIALAASILLFIGYFNLAMKISSRNKGVPSEVVAELQIIHDYLNSSDLEGDLELYAVVEGF